MSILNVARLGNPVLRTKSRQVDRKAMSAPELQGFIDDLVATMSDYRSLTLTAPQVHEPLRIIVMRAAEAVSSDAVVLVNPVVTVTNAEPHEQWERCPSLPGLSGLVARARAVNVRATDRRGQPLQMDMTGVAAAAIQHAMDHLDGALLVDRMPSFERLVFSEYEGEGCRLF